jgi:hypothetical protein
MACCCHQYDAEFQNTPLPLHSISDTINVIILHKTQQHDEHIYRNKAIRMGLFSRIMKYADNSFHLNQSIFISDRIYGFVSNKKRRRETGTFLHRNCVNYT